MKRRKVLVLGVGRFGSSIVQTLWHHGAEVIAVDQNAQDIDRVKGWTTAAFVGDATDVKALEGVGAREVEAAAVTFGENFEGAVLCVASLKRLGVNDIIARAATERQGEILAAVGATRVVQLESEMGHRIGADLVMPVARDLIDFAGHYRVVPWVVRVPLVGQTLATSALRQRFAIHVLGIRRAGGGETGARLEPPDPAYAFKDGDTLLLVGDEADVDHFAEEMER